MSRRPAISSSRRASAVACSTEKLPATVVTPRISSSGEWRARISAKASSCGTMPKSVSKMILWGAGCARAAVARARASTATAAPARKRRRISADLRRLVRAGDGHEREDVEEEHQAQVGLRLRVRARELAPDEDAPYR